MPRIAALHQALGITSPVEEPRAAKTGGVRAVRGFGAKTESNLLAALRQREAQGEADAPQSRDGGGRAAALTFIRSDAGVRQAELAGALRRREETVDRLVVAVGADDPARALDHVARYPAALPPVTRTPGAVTFRTANGLLVESEAAEPALFPALLHALTGSETHRARLTERAKERGLVARPPGTRLRRRHSAASARDRGGSLSAPGPPLHSPRST